jgi:hypothetical protein
MFHGHRFEKVYCKGAFTATNRADPCAQDFRVKSVKAAAIRHDAATQPS